MAWVWIAVGSVKPIWVRCSTQVEDSPKSANEVITVLDIGKMNSGKQLLGRSYEFVGRGYEFVGRG
jgi:hypothetical protein